MSCRIFCLNHFCHAVKVCYEEQIYFVRGQSQCRHSGKVRGQLVKLIGKLDLCKGFAAAYQCALQVAWALIMYKQIR